MVQIPLWVVKMSKIVSLLGTTWEKKLTRFLIFKLTQSARVRKLFYRIPIHPLIPLVIHQYILFL